MQATLEVLRMIMSGTSLIISLALICLASQSQDLIISCCHTLRGQLLAEGIVETTWGNPFCVIQAFIDLLHWLRKKKEMAGADSNVCHSYGCSPNIKFCKGMTYYINRALVCAKLIICVIQQPCSGAYCTILNHPNLKEKSESIPLELNPSLCNYKKWLLHTEQFQMHYGKLGITK